jgi:hypothetical protein
MYQGSSEPWLLVEVKTETGTINMGQLQEVSGQRPAPQPVMSCPTQPRVVPRLGHCVCVSDSPGQMEGNLNSEHILVTFGTGRAELVGSLTNQTQVF